MKTLKKTASLATSALLIQAACLNTALASPTQSSQPATSVTIDTRSTIAFQGMQYCGNFANADGSMAISLVDALGAGDLETREYTIAAHGCNRVQCWDTSGVYVCNVSSSLPRSTTCHLESVNGKETFFHTTHIHARPPD